MARGIVWWCVAIFLDTWKKHTQPSNDHLGIGHGDTLDWDDDCEYSYHDKETNSHQGQ